MKQVVFTVLFVLGIGQLCFTQTKKDYIYRYAEIAVNEMESSRIPASITLAQGILESRFGLSELSSKSNNHFGIKCHKGWTGQSVKHDDDALGECFRKYNSPEESFADHSYFLTSRSRYADLFQLSIYDYKGWARGLKKAGYATNPKYADHLIKIIEEEQLYVFDRMSVQEVGPYIASLQHRVEPKTIVYTAKQPTTQVQAVQQPSPPKTIEQTETTVVPKITAVIGGPSSGLESDVAVNRAIFIENDIKTVRYFTGDSPQKIAQLYDIKLKRLMKYNEWNEYFDEFEAGMKVYLQPKRSKSRDVSKLYHIVEQGQTMYQIAQLYGIKTSKLYQRNLLKDGQQPHPGEQLYLRKKRKTAPKLLNKSELITVDDIPVQSPDPEVENPSEQESEMLIAQEITNSTTNNVVVPTTTPSTQSNEPIDQPTNKVTVMKSDPWANGQYPSTESSKSTASQPIHHAEEEYEGRAIIYDPTPTINQQTVPVYQTTTHKTDSSNSSQNVSEPISTKVFHTVTKGDTLYGLSKKYNVSVQQIKLWNNKTSDTIQLGEQLIVGQ